MKESHTNELLINEECHDVTVSLTEDESIVVDIVEMSTKLKYKSIFIQDDFVPIIQQRIQLTMKQFYDILSAALRKEDNDMTLTGENGLTNGIKLKLTWKINNQIGLELPLVFSLEVAPVIQSDGERMDLITRSVNEKLKCQQEIIKQLTYQLEVATLKLINY